MITVLLLPAAFAATLQWEDVRRNTLAHMPQLLAAEAKIEGARARLRASEGAFDYTLAGRARGQQVDADANRFWEAKLTRPTTLWGAELFAGRRQGNGTYATFEGKSATSAVGEVFAGLEVPLLRDRTMDRPRLELGLATLDVRRRGLERDQRTLDVLLKTGAAYWKWVRAGHRLHINREWVEAADKRQGWLARRVQAGDTGKIKLVDAQRALAQGQANLAEAKREFALAQSELLLLSPGSPVDMGALPLEVPIMARLAPGEADQDRLPQFGILSVERQALEQKRDYARALALPDLRLGMEAARDLAGPPPGRSDDDQLRLAVRLEVPFENRRAQGACQEVSADLAALHHERVWLGSAWKTRVAQNEAAWIGVGEQLAWQRQELADTERLREAEIRRLEQGDSDIFFVILREFDLVKVRLALLETTTLKALTALEAAALSGRLLNPKEMP